MREIEVHRLAAEASQWIQRVSAGMSFYVVREGEPVAELRPVQRQKARLIKGSAASPEYWMSDDFNEPLEDFGDLG